MVHSTTVCVAGDSGEMRIRLHGTRTFTLISMVGLVQARVSVSLQRRRWEEEGRSELSLLT
jgi:hypothetical protein